MSLKLSHPVLAWRLVWRLGVLALALATGPTSARAAEKIAFDLPADSAEKSLRKFSTQSGIALVFPSELTRGVRTQAVRGTFTTREALDRLLANSRLTATENKKNGTIAISVVSPDLAPADSAVTQGKPLPDAKKKN